MANVDIFAHVANASVVVVTVNVALLVVVVVVGGVALLYRDHTPPQNNRFFLGPKRSDIKFLLNPFF